MSDVLLLKLADKPPVPVFLPDYQIEKDLSGSDIRERMRPELDQLYYEERYRPEAFLTEIGVEEEVKPEEELGISESALEFLGASGISLSLGCRKGTATSDSGPRRETRPKKSCWTGGS